MYTQTGNRIKNMLVPDRESKQERQRVILAFTITVVGMVLFVLLNVIAQLLPPYYSPIQQAVSDLAIGPYGWLLSLSFIVYSVALLAFLFGLIWATSRQGRSRIGFIFLGLWAVLPAVLPFFPTDIVDARGYPGSAQAFQMTTSIHGEIHLVISVIAFISAMLASLFISLRFSRDERPRPLRTPALVIALLMWPPFILTDTFGKMGMYGVAERVFLGLGLLWILMVALWLRQRLRKETSNADSVGVK